jgi:hypothetical protein
MKNYLDLFLRVKADKAKRDLKKVDDSLKKVGDTGKKAGKGLKTVDEGLRGTGKAGKLAGKGFSFMGAAIKKAGLGILISLFAALVMQLQKNQKFMDAMNKIFLALEPLLMAVADVIAFLVDGLANLIGVTLGAVGATNKLTEGLVEQRKKVQLLEAELGLIQLQYQREAELMRQIRDDEALTIQERIDANYELGKVLAEQLQHERSVAFESLKLAEIELAINKDNIDLQVALTEAKTKMAEIDERITGQRSEQLVNLNSLERDRKAQQKEAAAIREEQLKKEAEMLQNLIDLQNEDIKVKKKAAKTINEQFDNAEKQNQAQIDELERLKQAELDNLNARTKNAKQNLINQEQNIEGYKVEQEEMVKANEEKSKQIGKIAKEELDLAVQLAGHRNMVWEGVSVSELRQVTALNKMKIESVADLETYLDEYAENTKKNIESVTKWSGEMSESQKQLTIQQLKDREDVMIQTVEKIKLLTSASGEDVMDITTQQIQASEESAEASIGIVQSYADEKLRIEEKYATKIEETQESLNTTTLELQRQADEALFLHFETAEEKEIRLVEEKYAKLLGMAEGNFLATVRLKAQEEAELAKIETKAAKATAKNLIAEMKLIKAKAKAKKDLEVTAAQETFAMASGLAQEGTAAYKVLASAETYIATKSAATKALDDIPSPWNFIQAGLIIATGMKNLADIQKTKVPGGGGGGQPMGSTDIGGGISGDMTGGVPAITFGDAGSDVPPVQAYVIETDISNAQALQSELDLQSTL